MQPKLLALKECLLYKCITKINAAIIARLPHCGNVPLLICLKQENNKNPAAVQVTAESY